MIQRFLCVDYIILANLFPSYVLSGVFGECDYDKKRMVSCVIYDRRTHR